MPDIFPRFELHCNSSTYFHKSLLKQNSKEIRSVEAKLIHAVWWTEGQTERRTDGLTNSLRSFQPKTGLLWRLKVVGNNKRYLDLHVNCPIFLSHFNHCQYQFSLKPSNGIRADICRRMDGRTDRQTDRWVDRHDEANRRLLRLCERD